MRPVLWDQPNHFTIPMYLQPTPGALEWLAKAQVPMWQFDIDGKHNCLAMHRKLGHWPEPFLAEVESVMDHPFNDPIPF